MSRLRKYILLSFDVEEFDLPLEYGQSLGMEQQLKLGMEGLGRLLTLLDKFHEHHFTFFTTANFAKAYPAVIREIAAGGHEIASHGFYHSRFSVSHLQESRAALSEIIQEEVTGFRMPRMVMQPADDVVAAGYKYDASLHPVWIPGRYNHRDKPRTIYQDNKLWIVPASSTAGMRIPLFWLSFKNFPYAIYERLAKSTLEKDGYLSLYFHPWEFMDLDEFRVPFYTKRIQGDVLLKRLSKLISSLSACGSFVSTRQFLDEFAAGKII